MSAVLCVVVAVIGGLALLWLSLMLLAFAMGAFDEGGDW